MTTLTGTTRELACLALGHDDGDEPRCAASDEQLVRQLVDEVQQLRVAAGLVEATEADRQEEDAVLVDVLGEVLAGGVIVVNDAGPAVRVRLGAQGWQLVRVRRP